MTGTRVAYAAHRKKLGLPGASPPAVGQAIKAGRIRIESDGININFEQADKDWAANTNSSEHFLRAGLIRGANITAAAKSRREENEDPAPAPSGGKGDYNASRANREFYESELSRLKFEEKEGKLIPAEVVKKVLYAAGRIVRAGHDDIVSQLSPDLASETDIEAIERIVKKALDDLDNRLADKVESLVEEMLGGYEEASDEVE